MPKCFSHLIRLEFQCQRAKKKEKNCVCSQSMHWSRNDACNIILNQRIAKSKFTCFSSIVGRRCRLEFFMCRLFSLLFSVVHSVLSGISIRWPHSQFPSKVSQIPLPCPAQFTLFMEFVHCVDVGNHREFNIVAWATWARVPMKRSKEFANNLLSTHICCLMEFSAENRMMNRSTWAGQSRVSTR